MIEKSAERGSTDWDALTPMARRRISKDRFRAIFISSVEITFSDD
jgi:hypothetical protein